MKSSTLVRDRPSLVMMSVEVDRSGGSVLVSDGGHGRTAGAGGSDGQRDRGTWTTAAGTRPIPPPVRQLAKTAGRCPADRQRRRRWRRRAGRADDDADAVMQSCEWRRRRDPVAVLSLCLLLAPFIRADCSNSLLVDVRPSSFFIN